MVETFTQILEEKILEEGKAEYQKGNRMKLLTDITKTLIAMLLAFSIHYMVTWLFH